MLNTFVLLPKNAFMLLSYSRLGVRVLRTQSSQEDHNVHLLLLDKQ